MKGFIEVSYNELLYTSAMVDTKVFSGGEVNIKVPNSKIPYVTSANIVATIHDTEMLMALLQTVDALRIKYNKLEKIELIMPYAPYARQDRVCNDGESLSCKVFANLINSCDFNRVSIVDAHSDVLPALINNCTNLDVLSVINRIEPLRRSLQAKEYVICAPDFGSTKKVEKVAKAFKHETIIQGTKKRDLATGELSGFGAYGDCTGKDILIIDDICDGGGTFVGLAKVLKTLGAKSVSLYISHGIFSRGIDNLVDNGIDHVYTTNSNEQATHDKLTTLAII